MGWPMVKKNKQLLTQACVKFFSGVALVMLLVFLPAGTIYFAQGWLLMAVLFVPMFAAGLVMWRKAPDLLKSRLQAKEKEGEQRQVIAFSGAMFLIGFILCGLRFRWGWSGIPLWGSLCAAAVFLVGYSLFGLVLHQNAYLSRTIEVQSGQKVIDTGLYGLVRHPMYTATILMFLSMPLILGSWQAFPVFLLYLPIIVKRIRNEEVVLKRELAGYEDYCNRLKWRLIPYIW